MSREFSHAIYIGRFQPIHNAHLESIDRALKKADHLLLFLGSANKVETVKNPWSYEQRVRITQAALLDYFGSIAGEESILNRVTFIPLRDYLYNDYKWLSEVYAKAELHGAGVEGRTLLVGCEKDDSSYYLQMFPTWEFEGIPYLYNLDAVDIRARMFEQKEVEEKYLQSSTESYLNQWILSEESTHLHDEYRYYKHYLDSWSKAPYKPIFTTVDAMVVKSGCLLLIKRGFHPGKGLWALPGGFLDPHERIEEAALRELKEETRIKVPKHMLREGLSETRVFDHPRRSLRGRIITHVHLIDLGVGALPQVKASSDASGAHWIPIADVMNMEQSFFEDHFDIIFNMISRY